MKYTFYLLTLIWISCNNGMVDNGKSEAASKGDKEISTKLLAFPEAEGFGAYSKGGRGGRVLKVTNLNDSGPGSLRSAVEQEGPRTVVFEVSGIIDLKEMLFIKNGNITIAGQTAPGDGICLRGETLRIEASEVIVRFIKARLGDGKHGEGTLQGKDAISVAAGENIIVDHCSTSWSLDEVLSTSTRNNYLTNVTVQWCYITEALNPDGHGYGALVRGANGAKYSYLYNLFAHNHGRNPRPGNYDSNSHDKDPQGLLLDFRGNVIYNWDGRHAGYNADKLSVLKMNYVNNYLIPGSNSKNNGIAYAAGSPYNKAFFEGNYFDGKIPDNQWSLVQFKKKRTSEEINFFKQDRAFETGPIKNISALESYKLVLNHGGATIPSRDKVDERIIEDVKNKTGEIIESQEDIGGWPIYESTPSPMDTDQDGMPDEWEMANQLNKSDPEDRNQIASNGYTMLENYLNSID